MNKIEPTSPELQEALFELRRFLSDEISPLAVSDSISLLMTNDPDIMVSGVRSWVEAQLLRQQSVSTANCLYHALKKIHIVGELNLVSQDRLAKYVNYLSHFAIRFCPPPDRKSLAANLTQLGETEIVLESAVNFFYLQPQRDAVQPLTATTDKDYSKEAVKWGRRFDLLLERIEDKAVSNGFVNAQSLLDSSGEENESLSSAEALLRGKAGGSGALAARAFAMAAGSSQTEDELEQYLQRLGHNSLQASSQNILMTLGHNLPDWAVLTKPEPGGDDAAPPAPIARADSLLDAMQRMVTLATDPQERAKRFNEIVKTAIHEFNDGSLGRAVSMLDAAEVLIAAKEVEASTVNFVRQRGHEKISYEQLRAYVESSQQRPLVRKVLSFFEDLSPEGLLSKLRVEEVRNRRRLIMTLLEIHGTDARPIVFKALQSTLEERDDHIWYFQRNLLHLLHLIPRRIDICSDDEINIIISFTELRHPTQVIREALPNLALENDERAERGLIACLKEYENGLFNIDETPFPPSDLKLLVDRVITVLARVATPTARRAILEHGLKQQPQLGDTLARLAELGSYNLSSDEDLVKRILSVLARELPNKILSIFVKKDDKAAVNLMKALAGTPALEVRRSLEEIARKYSNQEFAKAAVEVLEGFDKVEQPASTANAQAEETNSPPPHASHSSNSVHTSFEAEATVAAAAASLSGDLALFGLPSLLQNLAESRLSGVLTLKNKESEMIGTISLDAGKIRASSAGRLQNVDAVYQLLQKPLAGTFQFVQVENLQSNEADGEPLELIPVLLEGMRRYDELQASSALVPDEAAFTVTEVDPTPHEEEQDEKFVQTVWEGVSAGATTTDCEEHLAVDSYRIRRLLSHWVEQGALRLVTPDQSLNNTAII